MTTDNKCYIHGYDFSDIVYADGVDISGGGVGIEEVLSPSRNYADVRVKGRDPKKYKIRARSTDRTEIETFLREVNTAPLDAEFYPFDDERAGYVASCHTVLRNPRIWGNGKVFYEAEAVINCREAWLYGPDQGIDMQWTVPLPKVSDALTNNGHEKAPISYMQCSGDRTPTCVEGLSVRVTPSTSTKEHDRELVLCDKMLRGHIFELGWRGEVYHSHDAPLISMAGLSADLHGKTSGGSISSGVLTLDNLDYVMFPFRGPLPVAGDPYAAYLELYIDAITGDAPTIYASKEVDLSDMYAIDHDELVVGNNIIHIPGLMGESDVAFGIMAEAAGSVDISAFKGTVHRYISPSKIPYADPDESFKVRVESTNVNRLRFLGRVCHLLNWHSECQ